MAEIQKRKRLEAQAGQQDATNAEIERLEGELVKAADYIKANKKELAALKRENAALKTRLEQTQAQAAQASSSRIAELETALDNANAKIVAEIQKRKRLEAQADSKDDNEAEIERLEGELVKAADYIKANKKKIAALEKEKAALETELEQYKAQTAQVSAARIAELETALDNANAKIVSALQEKSHLQTLLDAQEEQDSELQRLREELRKAAGELTAVQTENAVLQEKTKNLRSELEAARRTKNDLKAQLRSQSASLETQQQEQKTLKDQMTSIQSRLRKKAADVQIELEHEITGLQTEIASLTRKNEHLRQEVQQAQEQNQQLNQDIAQLQRQLLSQASVPDAAKQRIKELTEELQDARAQLDTQDRIRREYPRLQKAVTRLNEEIARLSKEEVRADSLQRQLREVELAYEQTRKELDAVASQNLGQQKQLEEKEELYQFHTKRYKDIAARNAELEKQYQEVLAEVKLKEQVLQRVATEKAVLEKVIDQEGDPFDDLKAKLRQAEEQNALLRQQLKDLNNSQVLSMQAEEKVSARIAALEKQLRQEKALRREIEGKLHEARAAQSAAAAPPVKQRGTITPVRTRSSSGAGTGPLNAMFLPEIQQHTQGNMVTMLGWSEDRTKLAYQETTATMERLWIFDMQSRQPFRVTQWQRPSTNTPSDSSFAWSHDNMHFLFATGLPGHYALYVGSGKNLIGNPIQLRDQTIHFAWSPTQLQFAYFSGANLVVQRVGGSALPVQIGHTPGASGTSLAWSPDGKKITFSSKRGNSVDIFVIMFSRQNNPLLQTLVSSSSDDIHPSWSPDGRNIAFYVRARGYDTKLAVIPVDKSRSPYIVGHNVSIPSSDGPVWASPKELLYVGADALYRVDITTGKRTTAPMAVMLSR